MSAKGIDWKNVSFVTGHRADLLPQASLPQPVFVRECEKCKAKTYTETEYPADVPIVCNVCASQITAQLEQDPSTLLLWDMPNDVKARLIDIARERRLPVEEVIKDFMRWKLGRQVSANLDNKSEFEKEKSKEK